MKKLEISILLSIIFCAVITMCGFSKECENVRGDVFRLHILANSDSREDQELKLKVRDSLLEVSEDIFSAVLSREQAMEKARENMEMLQSAAEKTIAENGYTYEVEIEIGESEFDTRYYEDFTLPAGTYQALKVKIGNAEGKNWWCVMFPQLCLPASGDRADIKEVLTEDEISLITGGEKYEFKFKCVEYYEKIKSFFNGD